jgi:hypothetical protein
MGKTESRDVPIRQSMVRSTTWHPESSSAGHRFALIVAMIAAAIMLLVLVPQVVH